MRNGTSVAIEMETGSLLSEVIASDVAEKIVAAWRKEYGTLIDFGGNVKDVTCYDLLVLCDRDPKKLRKLFPFLTVSEARNIIIACAEIVKREP